MTPHGVRLLLPIALSPFHGLIGLAEVAALGFSALAVRFGLIAAAAPSPTDWQGAAAFLLAICGVMGAFGTLTTILVKAWIMVTENRAKISGLEDKAVASAAAITLAKAETDRQLALAKAETDRQLALAKAEADSKVALAKAEADSKVAALAAQNAQQQQWIDSLRKRTHDNVSEIDGIKMTILADKAKTPDPDATINVHVTNDARDPVPVVVPVVVVPAKEAPNA